MSSISEPAPGPAAAPDSARLHSDARSAQARFERIRIRQSRLRYGAAAGGCDERVGRMCIRFPAGDGDSEWVPPPEPERIVEARGELLDALEEVGKRIPGDGWVLGQRLAYMGEADSWDEALALTEPCPLVPEQAWWCDALRGKALHRTGRFDEAEEAFERAFSAMPDAVRRDWNRIDWVVERGVDRIVRDAEGDSLQVLADRLWRLAEPLLLVPGNDRWTEHMARLTLARIRSDARNPYAMSWGDDLAEILVRYGPEASYEREPPRPLVTGPQAVTGRFDPDGRRFLPDAEAFQDPASVSPGVWRTDERRARARHAPAYAPRIGALEVDQLVFRRGEDMLVVLDWRIGDGSPDWNADESTDEALEAGLFFLDAEALEPWSARAHLEWEIEPTGPAGIAVGRVPAGRYLVSLELFDPAGHRAWRARHGAAREPLPRGVASLSDLALLASEEEGGENGPARCDAPLETELHRLLPGRLEGGAVEVAWEVYGLEGEDGPLRFRLSAEPEDRGFLRRAGEFLRILSEEPSIELGWEEGLDPERDEAAPLRRCLAVDLSSLPPGTTRLGLTLELPGRTPTRVERTVELAAP